MNQTSHHSNHSGVFVPIVWFFCYFYLAIDLSQEISFGLDNSWHCSILAMLEYECFQNWEMDLIYCIGTSLIFPRYSFWTLWGTFVSSFAIHPYSYSRPFLFDLLAGMDTGKIKLYKGNHISIFLKHSLFTIWSWWIIHYWTICDNVNQSFKLLILHWSFWMLEP